MSCGKLATVFGHHGVANSPRACLKNSSCGLVRKYGFVEGVSKIKDPHSLYLRIFDGTSEPQSESNGVMVPFRVLGVLIKPFRLIAYRHAGLVSGNIQLSSNYHLHGLHAKERTFLRRLQLTTHFVQVG